MEITVQQLIDMLEEVEDKQQPVYVYYSGSDEVDKNGALLVLDNVSDEGGRVDLNCTETVSRN